MRIKDTKRGGRASQTMTARVLTEYGTDCWLRLPGCTRIATTKDHVIPHNLGGANTLDNYRPACKTCNSKRGKRIISGYGARIVVVIGPPAAGKTTWVRNTAKPGDVVIDLDAIARALMPHPPEQTHTYPDYVRDIAIGARKAAIVRATRKAIGATVYIIHALPHPDTLAEYRALRYKIVTIDPGRTTVEARAHAERPAFMLPHVARWYATYGTMPPTTPEATDRPSAPAADW